MTKKNQELLCTHLSLDIAKRSVDNSKYHKAIEYLEHATRSLKSLQKMKEKEQNERELDEMIQLVFEDYALGNRVLDHYE